LNKRTISIPLLLSLVLLVIAGISYWWLHRILNQPMFELGSGNVEITIEKGMNLNQVAGLLEEKRLVRSQSNFRWAARIIGAEKKLQPGRFLLPRGVSNTQIIRYLLRPGIRTRDVTIPEGLTVRQIASIFQKELSIDSVEFVKICEDSAFTADLNIGAGGLEGYLFPDTYNFYVETNAYDIVERMVSLFFKVFNDSLKAQLEKTGLNLHQTVILASIIQGEVMIDEEAPIVSAVYHNRLKRKMLLAADPTIQYIIPDGPRRLLNKDIKIDSPYNTYRYRGLPPGPVNNPGRVALEAAAKPADVNYLFFVARGDGSHAFNLTHRGHTRDKQKLQKVRREVARKKRLESNR